MFDPTDQPRVFGLQPGVDFATGLVDGLTDRFGDLSRVRIFVNTSRMQRRIRSVFDAGPARLLPRVQLVTDLAFEGTLAGLPVPVSPLRRRLELSRAVGRLLDAEPELSPRFCAIRSVRQPCRADGRNAWRRHRSRVTGRS